MGLLLDDCLPKKSAQWKEGFGTVLPAIEALLPPALARSLGLRTLDESRQTARPTGSGTFSRNRYTYVIPRKVRVKKSKPSSQEAGLSGRHVTGVPSDRGPQLRH